MPRLVVALVLLATTLAACSAQPAREEALPGFRTNTALRSIDLSELRSGGPPKDGIPAIDAPRYVSQTEAGDWLEDREPVILLRVEDAARIYPLQILTWHEIANDTLGGVPVAVTFCPLCYAAVAFDRRIDHDGEVETLSLGVSGMLRLSDMVMYDRGTETLWQQLTGEALVGDRLGATLTQLPAQIVSFADARESAPGARVLSRETGHSRDYGRNPYVGYDDVDARPFLFDGEVDGRLPPMEHVVAVVQGDEAVAVSFERLRRDRVWQGTVGSASVAVIWQAGTATALGAADIATARDRGGVGVFVPEHDGRALTLAVRDGEVRDDETGSAWSVTGEAVSGSLAGARLQALPFHDTFAFAWLAFRPQTTVVE
ncbi:MAG: DUF3179 domain-containing protein [Bacteroidota bacterium]